MLITIGGLYGSGGLEMALALAKELGYPVHGKALMEKAAASSGVDLRRSVLDFFDETDESIDRYVKPYKNAILGQALDVLPLNRSEEELAAEDYQHSSYLSAYMDTLPTNRRLFRVGSRKADTDRMKFAQAKAVLDAAEGGNAIFVGRCAGYVLTGRPDVIRVFTSASMESCRKRVAEVYGMENKPELDVFIEKTNQRRAHFFEAFTGSSWDDAGNYDYCINTDCLGLEGSIELLKKIVELKNK